MEITLHQALQHHLDASHKGDHKLDLIGQVLKGGADINETYPPSNVDYNVTPLLWCINHRLFDAANLLVTEGANVHSAMELGHFAPLHTLAWCFDGSEGATQLVRNLLLRGADPNALADGKETPLHKAAREGKEALVKTLLLAGAHVEAKEVAGKTALWIANENGQETTVKILLQNGANEQEIKRVKRERE
ncbi:MAG: ankyrin repeat domain-containing protein [Parachlamydiales bacterium]